MELIEIILPLALVLFFFGLTAYGLSDRGELATLNVSYEDDDGDISESRTRYEKFPWGKVWVYDSDRLRTRPEKPIVFLHSIGSSIYSWRYQLDDFAKIRPVVAFDYLGFGKSEKPVDQAYDLNAHTARIIEILDSKKIDKCYLVGCSMGGALALWLTQLYPERFTRVVAIGPAAHNMVVPFPRLRHDILSPVGQRLVSRHLIKTALRGGYAYHDRITDEVIDNYMRPFRHPGAMICFLRSVGALADPRIFACLKNIKSKVLVLWGAGEIVITKSAIQTIVKENSNFKLEMHLTGGHHLMEDEPEWVNEKIKNFFSLDEV